MPSGGAELKFTSSTGSSTRGYAIGAPVALRYDPARPVHAAIDTPVDLWLVTGVLTVLGLAFTAVGSGMAWFFRPGSPVVAGGSTPRWSWGTRR